MQQYEQLNQYHHETSWMSLYFDLKSLKCFVANAGLGFKTWVLYVKVTHLVLKIFKLIFFPPLIYLTSTGGGLRGCVDVIM